MASWAWRLRTKKRAAPLFLGGTLALVLSACPLARGQQSDPAESDTTDPCLSDSLCRAHFARARKLSKSEDFEGALAAYQSAYRRKEVPWLLINLGRTLQKLGRAKEAIPYFQQYLALANGTTAELQDKARQYLKDAEQEVAALPVAPPPRPALPELKKPEQPPPEEEPPPVMPTPAPRPEPAVAPPQLNPPPLAPPPSRWRSAGFITGLTLGGLCLVSGAITGGLALSTAAKLRDTVYVGDPGDDQASLQKSAKGFALATDVLLPVGAVVLGTTLLVTALRRPRTETPSRLKSTAQLGSRSLLLSVTGAF